MNASSPAQVRLWLNTNRFNLQATSPAAYMTGHVRAPLAARDADHRASGDMPSGYAYPNEPARGTGYARPPPDVHARDNVHPAMPGVVVRHGPDRDIASAYGAGLVALPCERSPTIEQANMHLITITCSAP